MKRIIALAVFIMLVLGVIRPTQAVVGEITVGLYALALAGGCAHTLATKTPSPSPAAPMPE